MVRKLHIPKTVPITIQWIIWLWIIYFIIFTLFRIATVFLFRPSDIPVSSLFPSFWLGFQFDAKWIAVILLPIAIISVRARFSPFYSEKNKRLWSYYLALATLIVLFFFGADFGNFSYNHTRINASALNFAEDPIISFKMLWQSYPMVWILLGLFLAVAMLAHLFKRTHVVVVLRNLHQEIIYKKRFHAIAVFMLLWSLYGIFSFKPLQWKDAFELNDNFKSYVALNPLQNFFTTLRFRKPDFEAGKSMESFPVIANFLQLDSLNTTAKNYDRLVEPGSKALESRPNVVVVICESFSMYKSSMSGNPLNATPYFNELSKNGIFFERCFSPTFGTARGVFGILSGIPDVQLSKFSTRNKEALDQRMIINDFEEYNKFYFIGGSSGFNNFEGLVKNIRGITVYQEGSYKSPALNVWGISDKNLFLEADHVLSQQKKPFFAIIQTAGNHRPYSIPTEDKDFVPRNVPQDSLKKYGFESLEEFNAFYYSDYCFKKFMEKVNTQSYFNNTIFVFIGDHGVEGDATEMYPAAWTSNRLSDEHIPLLYYSPALLPAQQRKEVVSQIDVLPTLSGMLHQPYLNTTLGRDLLNTKNKINAAFIIHHDEGNIGVVTDDYYFVKNIRIKKEMLASVKYDKLNISSIQQSLIKDSLSRLTSALYETAKWMLVNNKKKE